MPVGKTGWILPPIWAWVPPASSSAEGLPVCWSCPALKCLRPGDMSCVNAALSSRQRCLFWSSGIGNADYNATVTFLKTPLFFYVGCRKCAVWSFCVRNSGWKMRIVQETTCWGVAKGIVDGVNELNTTCVFFPCYSLHSVIADRFLCLMLTCHVRVKWRQCLNILWYFDFRV